MSFDIKIQTTVYSQSQELVKDCIYKLGPKVKSLVEYQGVAFESLVA